MARIRVIGGSGYAGEAIVREAASRGHQVTAVSRTLPTERVDGVVYLNVDVLEAETDDLIGPADVVISALSPRGALEGNIEGVMHTLANEANTAGARLGVIGGAGSLRVSPDGPRLMDTDDFPAAFAEESAAMGRVLEDLRTSPETLDWFLVSPAAGFGAYAPGEHTGQFRVGGDVLLTDEEGRSELSSQDLAHAVVDEIERPRHRRQRFTVAY